MTQSRNNPMAWSMRTPPACRMQARKVAMNGANPPLDECARRKCGQTPILALRIIQIGRRADLQTREHVLLVCPSIAACAAHSHREIGEQTDTHAGLFSRALSCGDRAVGDPL